MLISFPKYKETDDGNPSVTRPMFTAYYVSLVTRYQNTGQLYINLAKMNKDEDVMCTLVILISIHEFSYNITNLIRNACDVIKTIVCLTMKICANYNQS